MSGECSWYEFAKKIFDNINMDTNISPICTGKQITKRPMYSVFTNSKLRRYGMSLKMTRMSKLILLMLIIVLIKIYLSLRFSTPFIFGDEYEYTIYIKYILENPVSLIRPTGDPLLFIPPGYSISLIPSFLFYPNMELIYRSILIINIIISTSIFLIAYFLLRIFIQKEDYVIFGSMLIVSLPINMLYNFTILSESLYISLYLFSGYLILASLEKENKSLHIITGFVLFFLIITRAFGMLAYVSFFAIIFYNIYVNKDKCYFLKKSYFLIFTPIILLSIWIILRRIYGFNVYGYDYGIYLQNMFNIFKDTQNILLFLKLFIHEIDYLILSSYFAFFIFSMFTVLYWNVLDQPTKTYVMYSFIYMILSVFLSALHMFEKFNTGNSLYYFMYGRYIDPILPTIFIIGLVLWDKLKDIDYNFFRKFLFLGFPIILIFVMTYPYNEMNKILNDRAINVISIYYTKYMAFQLFYAILIIFLIINFKSFRKPKILIMILIIFSLTINIPTYEWLEKGSRYAESTNVIGRHLQTINNETILMDKESFSDQYSRSHNIIKFWTMPNNLIYNNSTSLTSISDARYIISRKPLPYEILKISSDNIILYNTNIANDIQMIPLSGFNNTKYDKGFIDETWIGNNGSLYIRNPDKNSINISLILKIESVFIPRNLSIYINNNLSHEIQVPTKFIESQINLRLEKENNYIRFYTPDNCKRPSEVVKNDDDRCISFLFQKIKIIV